MIAGQFHTFSAQPLDFQRLAADNLGDIRPLAVSPLSNPEGVPIPWGFLISGASASMTGGLSR